MKSLQALDQKVENIKSQLEKDAMMREHIQELEEEDKYLRRRLVALERIVEKEYEDILNLERANLNALFSRILGNYEDQMDQEKQEYLEACLNYTTLIQEKELNEFEIRVLHQKLQDRDSLVEELELLFKEKERLLKSQNNSVSKQLLSFDKEMAGHKLKRYHIRKALEVGKLCQKTVNKIINQLKKVRYWGFADLKGKRIQDRQRRERFVELALQNAVEAQRQLNQYSKEIEKIFPDSKPSFQLDQFKIFVQTLVHHLVSDWIIERRIKMAFQGLEITLDQITLYLFNLEHELKECQRSLQIIEDEKQLYIENL